ncbi:MAG: DNA methyltransferase, partial [Candidatus Limnocylindrales bacterium]
DSLTYENGLPAQALIVAGSHLGDADAARTGLRALDWLLAVQTRSTPWARWQRRESDGLHPTQKPVELFARPIAYHTRPGDLCYDPFLGSGTALIAAEAAGRRCYGLEISPAYAQVCIERWQAYAGCEAVRDA